MTVDLVVLAPVLVVVATLVAVLLVDLLAPRQREWLPATTAVTGLAVALLAVGATRDGGTTFCGAGACSYSADSFSLAVQAVLLLVALAVVALSLQDVAEARAPVGEHHVLLLASVTGALLVPAARDLLTLVFALELVTLPAIALAGLRRRDARAPHAALTFFVVSAVATALTLLGVTLLYGATGTLHYAALPDAVGAVAAEHRPVAVTGALLTLAALLFKLSAVPFHFWSPDTYRGVPLPVAAWLAVGSKTAGVTGLLVLLVAVGPLAGQWGVLLAVLAAVTMTVGNLGALRQRQAVRLLAWSSVAHAGYLLVPLATAATTEGQDRFGAALQSTMAYLVVYVAMTLGAFACVQHLARHRPRALVADHRGLVRRAPWLGLSLAFLLVSLAGLPPGIAGLLAKVVVVRAALDGGLAWLAVVLVVNTVVGAAYYLWWAARLFAAADPADEPVPAGGAPLVAGVAVAAVIALVVIGFWPAIMLVVEPGLGIAQSFR